MNFLGLKSRCQHGCAPAEASSGVFVTLPFSASIGHSHSSDDGLFKSLQW